MKKLIFLLLIAYTTVANAQFVFKDGTAAARVDTLVLKADKLWFKNKATSSIFYARTSGDTLYLGDTTGEKALTNMGGGGSGNTILYGDEQYIIIENDTIKFLPNNIFSSLPDYITDYIEQNSSLLLNSGTTSNVRLYLDDDAQTSFVVYPKLIQFTNYNEGGYPSFIVYDNGYSILVNDSNYIVNDANGLDIASISSSNEDDLPNRMSLYQGNLYIGVGITETVKPDSLKVVLKRDLIIPATKWHRIDTINTSTADVWQNVKFTENVDNESTYGFEANSDSTGFVSSIKGLFKISGCGHWKWNGGDSSTVKVFIRVTVNDVEKRCSQSNDTRTNLSGDDGTLPYFGTILLNPNDVIRVQYRVDNVNLDFEGNAVFDYPISFSVNIFKISDKDIGSDL